MLELIAAGTAVSSPVGIRQIEPVQFLVKFRDLDPLDVKHLKNGYAVPEYDDLQVLHLLLLEQNCDRLTEAPWPVAAAILSNRKQATNVVGIPSNYPRRHRWLRIELHFGFPAAQKRINRPERLIIDLLLDAEIVRRLRLLGVLLHLKPERAALLLCRQQTTDALTDTGKEY